MKTNEKSISWTITNRRTKEQTIYWGKFSAVSEEHVRTSPAVKAWANGDEIDLRSGRATTPTTEGGL